MKTTNVKVPEKGARLQDIPVELHKRVRIAAAVAGVQIREWIVTAIENELKREG